MLAVQRLECQHTLTLLPACHVATHRPSQAQPSTAQHSPAQPSTAHLWRVRHRIRGTDLVWKVELMLLLRGHEHELTRAHHHEACRGWMESRQHQCAFSRQVLARRHRLWGMLAGSRLRGWACTKLGELHQLPCPAQPHQQPLALPALGCEPADKPNKHWGRAASSRPQQQQQQPQRSASEVNTTAP
jgi:hypothetical protein